MEFRYVEVERNSDYQFVIEELENVCNALRSGSASFRLNILEMQAHI
jgi:hypothetical protein